MFPQWQNFKPFFVFVNLGFLIKLQLFGAQLLKKTFHADPLKGESCPKVV